MLADNQKMSIMPVIEPTYIQAIAAKLLRSFEIKVLAGLGIAALSFLFDSVYLDAMIAILILMVFDFVTAIAAQKRRGHQIHSAKVFRSAKKVATYFLLISAGRMAETATHGILPILDETIMGFLAVTELISILENVGYMGYAVPQKLLNQLIKYKNNK